MGKAQSKRSLDITKDVKKDDVLEEGTGKMEKIEDLDQLKPQVNGDTHHNDTEIAEKDKNVETEGTENEKDLSTEKEQKPNQEETPAAAEVVEQAAAAEENAATDDVAAVAENKTVENGNGDETLNESKASVEATATGAENGESCKKKKEKLKKKWSFRSISFGKKDKQKPSKKDETNVNGECEKVPEETTEEQPAQTPTENTETKPEETTDTPATANTQSEEAAVAEKPAVTVNGTTEQHTKEESAVTTTTTTQQAPPTVTETPATPAAEEKKSEPEQPVISNDKPVTPEQQTESVAAEPCIEVSKSIELEQPATTKIEVKAEDNKDETTTKAAELATADNDTQQAQMNIENEKTNKINDIEDGENESAQNLPPPPLPCTPPPSQVMVFALSDIKSNDQEPQPTSNDELIKQQEEQTPTTVEELSSTQDEPSKTSEEATTVEQQKTDNLDIVSPPKVDELLASSGISVVTDGGFELVSVEKPVSADDLTTTNELEKYILGNDSEKISNLESDNSLKQSENIPSEIVEPSITKSQVEFSESVPTEKPKDDDEKLDILKDLPVQIQEKILESTDTSDINAEKIAETIALIDEVTQEAATISQKMLDDSNLVSSPSELTKDSAEKCDIEKTDNSAVINAESVTADISSNSPPHPEGNDNINNSQMAPEQISISETMPTTNTSPSEQPSNVIVEDKIIEKQAEILENVKQEEQQPQQQEQRPEHEIIGDHKTEEQPQLSADNKIDEEQKDITVKPEHIEESPISNSKENGVAENHEQLAETSATESLNGHAEHNKTVEEIKAENAEKINIEGSLEKTAETVKVGE